MKIEKTRVNFSPVVLTLESQDEVDIIYELLGCVGGTGEVRTFIDGIVAGMEGLVSNPDIEGGQFFEKDSFVTTV